MQKIRALPLGIDSGLMWAQEYVYRPGMNTQLHFMTEGFEPASCVITTSRKTYHIGCSLGYGKMRMDLFTMITVDYYSKFWEADALPDTGSKSVFGKLKAHREMTFWAQYSPTMDPNLPWRNSRNLHENGSLTTTSPPQHIQSNGKVESAVKAAKSVTQGCFF